jgi:NAD(P)H dehydrogenase (quinone)
MEPDMAVKVAVIYYSATGTVHALAEALADGADSVGAEVRLRRVAELAPEGAIDQFIDQAVELWRDGTLADKPVTAFTSAFNRHGGNETTILSLANVFYHWGSLIVPPGYTDPAVSAAGGNPYGASSFGPPSEAGPAGEALDAARYQGRRLAEITIRLLGGSRITDAAAGDGNTRAASAGTASQTA